MSNAHSKDQNVLTKTIITPTALDPPLEVGRIPKNNNHERQEHNPGHNGIPVKNR